MNAPGSESGDWRRAPRYTRDDAAGRAVLDALDTQLAGLAFVDTAVWVFDAERCQCLWANPPGLRIWKAQTNDELQRRDIASSQSDAVYTLLNDYLRRVDAGEVVASWVMLNPAGTTRRSFQTHHVFVLADGRKVLLIEAQIEPPAEEMLAFAVNHSLTIGLFEMDGAYVSGNPAFTVFAGRIGLARLEPLLPADGSLADWAAQLDTRSTLVWEVELPGERGRGWFRCELRRVTSQHRAPRAILSLFDLTEERLARAQREHALTVERSLAEKEVLLKEIHHRVKNNLQIVSSLLTLQMRTLEPGDARTALEESAYRVLSMALVHEQMYGMVSLDRIDFGAYAERLVTSMRSTYAPGFRLAVEVQPVDVTLDMAVPLGLILTELTTNAFKYGAPIAGPDPGWDIRVEVGHDADALWFRVSDRGPGLPNGLEPNAAGSLGLQLVTALKRQLRGTLTLDPGPGAVVRFRCARPRFD